MPLAARSRAFRPTVRSARNSARMRAVCEARGIADRSVHGEPCATIRPPPSPPSGPRSMIQSASAMTSRLCSMTTTRVAGVDQTVQHVDQLLDVGHVQTDRGLVEHVERVLHCACAPGTLAGVVHVGAHLRKLGHELDALRFAAGQRRALLPEREIAEPTSCSRRRQWWIERCAAKNSTASSTLIASTSPIDLPLKRTASVSALKRAPPQTRTARARRAGSSSRCASCPGLRTPRSVRRSC